MNRLVPLVMLVLACAVHAIVRYDDHKLVRLMNPQIVPHAVLSGLDRWRVHYDGSADFRVTSNQLSSLQTLSNGQLQYTVLSDNIQAVIDASLADNNNASHHASALPITTASTSLNNTHNIFLGGDSAFHSQFHPPDDIRSYFEMLANTRPGLLTLYPQIGRSYFGRPIFAVAITGNNSPTPSETTNKPTIYIQCLIHAREWISGAMCPYIADVLTASYGSDPRITSIMDRARIAMVPIVNPDGYAYTFTTDRMFRKNMRAVDLNRNHVFMWGRIGASANPRDETYRGPGPASEPETQTIVSFQSNQPTRIIGALDFHSYGQDILRPFGHTSQPAPDEARLAAVSNRMANAIRRVRGNVYKSAPSGIGLYWTSGTADDDFYVRLKAYSLTVELSPPDSDSGNLGFIISPRWIRSVGNDMIPAVLEFAEFTLANPLN